MTSAVLFLLGVFMDKTILGILIGSFTTLLGVALSSLFNHLTKRKELRHNEYLKELELKDRAKERKFKVEEKMIEKSIEAHKNAWGLVLQLLGLIDEWVEVGEDQPIPPLLQNELHSLLGQLRDFNLQEGFFLEKRIRQQIEGITLLVIHKVTPGREPELSGTLISKEIIKTTEWLRVALEAILKEYNPLYDLGTELLGLGGSENLFKERTK